MNDTGAAIMLGDTFHAVDQCCILARTAPATFLISTATRTASNGDQNEFSFVKRSESGKISD